MRTQCQNCVLGVKWFSGCSEEGDHEVYSICYTLRKGNTQKIFNFQFFYELKAKGSSIIEKFAWGFHFLVHLGFTKVHFYFKGVSKNCESVKKGKKN